MKSVTGGLIFRHSSCSELAPTGFSNRAGQGLEHQPACGCTTSQEQRLLEYSLRTQAGREPDSPIGRQLRFFRFDITPIGRRKIPGGNAYKPVAACTVPFVHIALVGSAIVLRRRHASPGGRKLEAMDVRNHANYGSAQKPTLVRQNWRRNSAPKKAAP